MRDSNGTSAHDPMRELDDLMRDKLEVHCRQQLSTMLDGALAPDQAKFLLRRLQHDHELAGCWERWQVYGDLLRGGVPALLPADFSQRVRAALAGEDQVRMQAAAGNAARPRWAGWAGGAALAASVAVAALLVSQRAPVAGGPGPVAGPAPQLAAAASAGTGSVAPARPAPSRPARSGPAPSALDAGAAAATALAAAEVPRRTARRERSAPPRAMAASRSAAPVRALPRVEAPPSAAAAGAATVPAAPASDPLLAAAPAPAAPAPVETAPAGLSDPLPDPFVDQQRIAPPRPWPRAVLPGLSSESVFTVGYGAARGRGDAAGADVVGADGFEYFQPRLPPEPPPP